MHSPQSPHESTPPLPPGQRELAEFPRFGIVEFAKRPLKSMDTRLEISGALERSLILDADALATLSRLELTADFHCAAGWSHRGLRWSGYRFRDVWESLIVPHGKPSTQIEFAVLRGQDGYKTILALNYLLAPEVMIVDRLNDEPLSIEHGAPIRLIAPAHYGYKSAKHLHGIELRE